MHTVAGCFLAYITLSIQRKRYDDPLLNLAPYGGLLLCFIAFWDTPETITQSKQVWLLQRFVCVFFSVILRCTQIFSFLAWFFFFLNILAEVLKWYICLFDEIFIVNSELLVIHEWQIHLSNIMETCGLETWINRLKHFRRSSLMDICRLNCF